MTTDLEQLRRQLALSPSGQDPEAALAFAKLLLRRNEVSEAVAVLSPYLGDPRVYPLLDPLPCWSHKDGDAGSTRHFRADLIKSQPRLRWTHKTEGLDWMGPYRLLAGPLGVVLKWESSRSVTRLLLIHPHDGTKIAQTDTYGKDHSICLLGGVLFRCYPAKVQAFELGHKTHVFQKRFDIVQPHELHVSRYDFSRRDRSPFLESGTIPLTGALRRVVGDGGYLISRSASMAGQIVSWGRIGKGHSPQPPDAAWLRVFVAGSQVYANLITGQSSGADIHVFDQNLAAKPHDPQTWSSGVLGWSLAWTTHGELERADTEGALIWEQGRVCVMRDREGHALWQVEAARSLALGEEAVMLLQPDQHLRIVDRTTGNTRAILPPTPPHNPRYQEDALKPVVVSGRGGFYVGHGDHVCAYNLDGQRLWEFDPYPNYSARNPVSPRVSAPRLVALAPYYDRLYILDDLGRVYCLERAHSPALRATPLTQGA